MNKVLVKECREASKSRLEEERKHATKRAQREVAMKIVMDKKVQEKAEQYKMAKRERGIN